MNHCQLRLSILSVLAAYGAVACGGTSSSPGQGGPNPTTTMQASNPCGLHTQFDGDTQCILPPAETEGMQLHVGPTDYDNPDQLWLMQPGAETVECYHLNTPNTDTVYYFKQQYRMRPGSHHMIIQGSTNTTAPEGWGPCTSDIVSAIGGTEHLTEDFPPNGVIAPEDEGLGKKIDPGTPLDLQLHFFNATTKPTLREVWVNLLYVSPESVKQIEADPSGGRNLGMLGGFANVDVPPHTSGYTTSASCDFANAVKPGDGSSERVVALFAHDHYHNKRFVVYKDAADGSSSAVYDSYAGPEAPTLVYNSLVQNPVADPANRISGGLTGALTLAAGDRLRFECDIDNDLNTALRETEQVYTGEMCNLFGSVVGLGFPCFALTAQQAAAAQGK